MTHLRFRSRALVSAAFAAVLALPLIGCPKTTPGVVSGGPEQGIVIDVQAGGKPNPNPFHPTLSKKSKPFQDHIRWHNLSGTPITVHFTVGWPFMGSQQDIDIPVDGYSAWFTVDQNASNTGYPYHITGVPTDGGGGPGDPDVSAEP